jgi:hypothetical protein
MWNASIFSAKGKTPWEDVKREYVRKVFAFDFCFRMPLLHIRIMGKNIWR